MADSAPAGSDEVAARAVAALYERDRASQMLGMRVIETGPGRSKVAMTIRPDMCNGHLISHGGLIFTLADSAFAFACNSYNRNTVAAGATIDFLMPARLGDELTADARELWRPGRSGLYEITITNQRGERVALFRGRSHELPGAVTDSPTPGTPS